MDSLWVVVFLLEFTKCLLIGSAFFEIRGKGYWVTGAASLGYFGVICWKPFTNDEHSLWIAVFVVICLLCFINGRFVNKWIGLIKILFVASSMDGIVSEILKLICGAELQKNISYYIVCNMISICIVLIFLMIKKKSVMKKDGFLKVVIYICTVIMGSSLFIMIPILGMWMKENGNLESARIIHVLIIAYYFSIMVLVLFLIYENNSNHKMKRYLQTEQLLKVTQKNYYEMKLEKEDMTRKFRHDMINHFMCLHELILQDKKEETLAYIEKLSSEMGNIQQKCYYVGNPVIEAMMNYYLQLLDKEVSIAVSGTLEKEPDLSQAELCVIFSNLIKNAVEELNRQTEGEKYLKIIFHCGLETVKMEIINSTSEVCKEISNKRQKNYLPQTIKKDHKNHGIGLKNVQETAEKNHGIFLWEHSENCFKATVVLPCRNLSEIRIN